MKTYRIILNQIIFVLLFAGAAFSQISKEKMDSIRKFSSQDHELMLQKLKIEALRPGPSGNPADENAANSDESLVNPLKELPDPLIFNNGEKVENK